MGSILDRIADGKILLSDGAFGTMLFQKGLQPGECLELLNLEKPEWIRDIIHQYLDAGSGILHTNTFGASPVRLAEYNLEKKAEEINHVAVSLAREVTGNHAYLSGSCGPTGKILKPFGDADPDQIYNSFVIQMKSLIDAGVDLITIETMIDLQEALLAVKAVRDISTSIPIFATMSFNKTPNGFFTVMGNSIQESAEQLERAGANIVGSNCGNGLETMIEIAQEFSTVTSLPVMIQSNAGLPEVDQGNLVYPESPSFFKARTRKLIDTGVSIIGGCCGTTPEHIQAMKEVFVEMGKS